MKKFATIALAVVLSMGILTGCGSSKKAAEATTEVKEETVDYGQGLNEDGTLEGVKATDYVTVCDYSALKIPKKEVKVSDSDVQTEIDTILSSYNQVTDRKVKKGDTVNIDYKGMVDGKEFDGGTASGASLKIGSGTFIDGFEDQLIGKMPGETVQVKVTFPKDYQGKEVAGKDAVFETTINYIDETPKLTDKFVKEKLSDRYGYTTVKEKKKTKGRVRLETLVKSGRPLTVFSVKESDLKQFVQEAKRYGVLYCAVRNPRGSSDGLVDVIVKEEDAPRINRIVDRFQFASVTEAAKIKTEIERTRAEKAKAGKSEKQEKKPEKVQVQQEKQGQAEPEKDYPQKSKEDQLMDELFGESVKKEGKEQNPSLAKTTKSRLSEPTSKKQEKTAEGSSKLFTPEKPEKPSVRKELREIQNARKKEAERRENRNDPVRNQGNKDRNQIRHQQPQQKRKPRKGKER